MSSLSSNLIRRWAPAALLAALVNCGGGDTASGDSSGGEGGSSGKTGGSSGKSGGSSGKTGGSGGKTGSGGSGGSGSNGSGSNGSGSNGSGSNGSGSTSGSGGSSGSGGGINIGGGTGVDCNRKDGKVDQQGCSCTVGTTQACFVGGEKLAGVGICKFGKQECIKAPKTPGEVGPDNVWGPCTGSGAPLAEVCDDVDQNCNGDIKEACSCKDKDVEGCTTAGGQTGKRTCEGGQWGACVPDDTSVCKTGQSEGCTASNGKPGTKLCDGGAWGPCVPDNTSMCSPGQSEGCTTADGKSGTHACDGGAWGPCVPDNTTVCTPGQTQGCSTPDGKIGSKTCNAAGAWGPCSSDNGGTCVPSPETCDGIDNDCDGKVDGFKDASGCADACPGGGERLCLDGSYTPCNCGCAPQACSTICGPGIQTCDASGQLGPCEVPPVDQICLCADGSQGTATCANGQVGACQCNNGTGGSGGASGNGGSSGSGPSAGGSSSGSPCVDCIQTECSYEKIANASETLGNDTSQCKSWYDSFIACAQANPGAVYFNGPCDQAIGGCDGDCGCGNIIRLAADCASTGNGVGVGQLSPTGCSSVCQ